MLFPLVLTRAIERGFFDENGHPVEDDPNRIGNDPFRPNTTKYDQEKFDEVLKLNLGGHGVEVLRSQVTIRAHRQCPTVLMPKPSAYGRNVHTRFNAACSE